MLSTGANIPADRWTCRRAAVRLTCAVLGAVGERVVLYLEQIGRLEGVIVRHPARGFAMQLNATPRKREKIASH